MRRVTHKRPAHSVAASAVCPKRSREVLEAPCPEMLSAASSSYSVEDSGWMERLPRHAPPRRAKAVYAASCTQTERGAAREQDDTLRRMFCERRSSDAARAVDRVRAFGCRSSVCAAGQMVRYRRPQT